MSGRLAVTDSTHVKANASRASEQEVDALEEVGNYWERLDAYEEEGLEELKRQTGQRRSKRTKQVKKDQRFLLSVSPDNRPGPRYHHCCNRDAGGCP